MKPIHLMSLAIAITFVRLAFYVMHVDEHASIVSNMPLSEASLVLGPLAIATALAAPIVAPVCVAAAIVLRGLQIRRA